MSIEKMISEHPDVGGDFNPALGLAVRHAMYCAAICNSCADACSAEEMDMRQCIRLCMDCSDVCEATYRVASRRERRPPLAGRPFFVGANATVTMGCY